MSSGVHVGERIADLRLTENLFLFFASIGVPPLDDVLILTDARGQKFEITLHVLKSTVDMTFCHDQLVLGHKLIDSLLRIAALIWHARCARILLDLVCVIDLLVVAFLFLTIFLFDLFHLQFLSFWSKVLSDICHII